MTVKPPMPLLALLLAGPAVAQQIPMTDKIMRLDGTWVRAPEKGWGGICGVPASKGMEVHVSPTEIAIRRDTFLFGVSSQSLQPFGVVKLDGSQTVLADGRTAAASHDAGWLAVTMTRPRPGASTLVMREVYNRDGNVCVARESRFGASQHSVSADQREGTRVTLRSAHM